MVAMRYGNTITGAFAVKQRLDLERIETTMRYVTRYAIDFIEPGSEYLVNHEDSKSEEMIKHHVQ